MFNTMMCFLRAMSTTAVNIARCASSSLSFAALTKASIMPAADEENMWLCVAHATNLLFGTSPF